MLYASRFLRLTDPFMQGPDVLHLQQKLKEAGFYSGDEKGIFDAATQEAVSRFQNHCQINEYGVVGPQTWQRLNNPEKQLLPVVNIFYNAQENISIYVDTDKRRLTLNYKSKITTYPVAVGKKSTPTPVGNWKIVQKAVNPGGPFGARWMRLSVPWGGYGIHGTNNPASIGKAVSHGCIRLYNEDVIEVYNLVPLGTPVYITGKIYTGRRLTLGSKGTDVLELQKMLLALGYYTNGLDGIFGQLTQEAVIKFQKDHKLKPDGICGPITYKAVLIEYEKSQNDIEP